MLEFEPMRLSHKTMFDEYTKNLYTSESSFAALFSWTHKNHVKILEKDGFLFRFAETDNPFYLFPLGGGNLKDALEIIEQDASERGCPVVFRAITEPQRKLLGGGFTYTANRDYADYLYNPQDLIELKGRAYHSKRNFIARFERENDWEYENITDDNISDVWEFQDRWCRKNDCSSNIGLQEEATCIAIMLYNLEALGAYGGLLRANGKVAAFTIGSVVGGETLEIHVEKADYDVTGAYPMINREFARRHAEGMRYVNREEDLGLESLRKAKLSYHPCEIAMKYTAVKEC